MHVIKLYQIFKMEDYLPISQISHMPFIFQNNAKCTYFQSKIYLRVPKMYLVNNVLENQIRAVPPLSKANLFLHLDCTIDCKHTSRLRTDLKSFKLAHITCLVISTLSTYWFAGENEFEKITIKLIRNRRSSICLKVSRRLWLQVP